MATSISPSFSHFEALLNITSFCILIAGFNGGKTGCRSSPVTNDVRLSRSPVNQRKRSFKTDEKVIFQHITTTCVWCAGLNGGGIGFRPSPMTICLDFLYRTTTNYWFAFDERRSVYRGTWGSRYSACHFAIWKSGWVPVDSTYNLKSDFCNDVVNCEMKLKLCWFNISEIQ